MTTTESEPTKRDQTWADTNRVPGGDPAPPRQGAATRTAAVVAGRSRDWMRRDACRPRPTNPGVFEDGV